MADPAQSEQEQAVVTLAEVRLHEMQEALEVAAAGGVMASPDGVDHTGSLIVREGDEILAVAVSVKGEHGEREFALAVMPGTELSGDVKRQMVGKGMMKVRSAGGSCCRVKPGDDGEDGFWSAVRWMDPPAAWPEQTVPVVEPIAEPLAEGETTDTQAKAA